MPHAPSRPGAAADDRFTVLDGSRLLFGLCRGALVIATVDGTPLDVNAAALDMLGYSRDEFFGLNVRDLCEDPGQWEEMLEELRTGSVVTERELRVVRRDGRALDCLFSFAVGRDGPDDAVVLCGTLQDISAEERRYEELVTSEERYHLLFEQSDDAIALVRVDGVLLDANQVFLDLFGYSRSDIGRVNTAHTYVKPADRERFMHQIAEKGWLKDEVRLRTRAGIVRDFARSSVERRDRAGRLLAYQSVLHDITHEKRLHNDLVRSHARIEQMLHGMVGVVEQLVERRDAYTAGHQRRVAALSVAIARCLDLPEETCVSLVDMAARVHDIGKIAVPAEILAKPAALTTAEFALIREHPRVGCDILRAAELPYPVAEAVLQHHERLDGSGYPQGLAGDDILPEARILAVADVVEAMSSHRPYRPALGLEAALDEVTSKSGILYDCDVVNACTAVFAGGFSFPQ